MAAAKTIPIRLTDEKWAYYSDRAREEGIGLSTHLRRRLEQGDDVANQIEALRRQVEEAAGDLHERREVTPAAAPLSASSGTDPGVILEILLLLRSVVSPDKMGMVQNELKRLGLSVWSPQK